MPRSRSLYGPSEAGRVWKVLLVWSLVVIPASGVRAQGTITSTPASFVRGTGAFSASPSANFTGVSSTLTTDHLFETGWWFRVSGDAQEFFFPVPTTQTYNGNTSTLLWADVNSRGLLAAREVAVVTNLGGPSGVVQMTMAITNISAAALTIDVFHLADIDLAGAGSDSASLLSGTRRIGLTDPSGSTAQYAGAGADNFLVRSFGSSDIGAVLENAAVNDFDNTGVPFGPADFTGGMQWKSRVLPVGGTLQFDAYVAVNTTIAGAVDIDGDGVVQALTDGILFLRYSFGFRGAVLTTGAVGGGCSRCTAGQIEGYIASLGAF